MYVDLQILLPKCFSTLLSLSAIPQATLQDTSALYQDLN